MSAAVWSAVLVAVTIVFKETRGDPNTAHVILAYLLIVLGGSASGGRVVGFSLACISFLVIDFFFQVPYDHFSVDKPLDWVVLVAFLITAGVATQLLAVARAQAERAQHRADEVAALSAERERLMREAEHAEALREANRMKDSLLASVSHDLRTPLTTIKALAEDSKRHGDENAAIIEEQADRLGRFVSDLLDLSRLNGGALPLTIEENTAEDLVGAAIRNVAGLVNGRTITAAIDTSAPALVGRFDFVQSLRILSNLLENALRYAPAGTSVELGVAADGGMLVFSVADRGPGVPGPERHRIFEMFYRAAGQAPDAGRSGLGLFIARRIAELQGGTLSYEDRPGGGARFVLRLPLDDNALTDS